MCTGNEAPNVVSPVDKKSRAVSGRTSKFQGVLEHGVGKCTPCLEATIFLFPLVATSCFIYMKSWWPELYVQAVQEDSIVEYAQAVLYLSAALVAFSTAVVFFRSGLVAYAVLYSALACALFFVTAEEISWGQRLFDIPIPEYFQKENSQGELTIHNLGPIHRVLHPTYMIVGFLLAFSWLFLTRGLRSRYPLATTYLVPSRLLMLYFLPVTIIYFYIEYGSQLAVGLGCVSCGIEEIVIFRDQEPAELMLALGLLLFVTINRIRISRDRLLQRRPSSIP